MIEPEVIVKRLERYLKRFGGLDFATSYYSPTIFIKLKSGDIPIYSRSTLSFSKTRNTVNTDHVDQLDPKRAYGPQGVSDYRLETEIADVFSEIVKFIKDNFKDNKSVYYVFIVDFDYKLKKASAKSGDIAKPTKIDHKTFKGRKRRSVAEAIIGGYFCDC